MKRGLVCLLGVLLASPSPTVAQSGLPVQVRVDLLKQEIFSAVDAKRYREVATLIDRYYAMVPLPRPPLIYMIDARVSLQNGAPQRAQQALDNYLNRASPQDEYYAEALALYPKLKQAIEAEKATLKAEEVARHALAKSLNYYGAYFSPRMIGHGVSAATALTRADLFLKTWPKSAFANSARAEALARLKRFGEAKVAYEKAIALKDGEYLTAYLSRAFVEGIGTPQSRVDDVAKFVSLRPDVPPIYGIMDLLNNVPGSTDRILAIYNTAVSRYPKDKDILTSRAGFYVLMKKTDLAIADYSTLMQIDPNETWHQFARCRLRAEANIEISEAVADCDARISKEKKPFGFLYRVRALAHLRAGNNAGAISDYESAFSVSPKDSGRSEVFFGRGIAKLRLGDRAGGQADIAASDAIESGAGRKKFAEWGITP